MGTGASASASDAVTSATPEQMKEYMDSLSPEDRAKLQSAVAQAKASTQAEAPKEAAGEAAAAPAEVVAEAAAPAEAAGEAAVAPAEAAGAAGEAAAAPAEAAGAEASTEAAGEAEAVPVEAAAPAEAAAEAKAPAEATETAAVPAEATGEATAPAAATSAPFLAEYFAKVQKRTADLLSDSEKLMALAVDPEAKKKLSEESKAWYESEAKPLLEKSFKHHDTSNTGVLDKTEAAIFFKHMVCEETDFAQAMVAFSIEAGIKMSLATLESLSEEEREKIKPQLEEQMKKQIESSQAEVQKKEDNYKANKAELDAAAFKVLDTSGDGTLQLAEFLSAFEPDSTMNLEVHMALGYVTKEEVDEQKKREAAAKEQAADCAQQ